MKKMLFKLEAFMENLKLISREVWSDSVLHRNHGNAFKAVNEISFSCKRLKIVWFQVKQKEKVQNSENLKKIVNEILAMLQLL